MDMIILANFKANLSPGRLDGWLQIFGKGYRASSSVQVVLAVPFVSLAGMAKQVAELEQVVLAAQSVSPWPPGSYTGATPAAWLQGLVEYALVGHRERRHYFHEDVQSVAGQVRESVAAGIKPVLCLDRDNRSGQLAALDSEDMEQCLLAYTPENSVQLEIAAEQQDIIETAASLASAGGRAVLYGGGVNRENAADLINLPGITGIMVGKGCLDGAKFAELVNSIPGG